MCLRFLFSVDVALSTDGNKFAWSGDFVASKPNWRTVLEYLLRHNGPTRLHSIMKPLCRNVFDPSEVRIALEKVSSANRCSFTCVEFDQTVIVCEFWQVFLMRAEHACPLLL